MLLILYNERTRNKNRIHNTSFTKSRWEHLYTFGYPKRPFPTNYENDLNNIKIGLYEGFKLQAERMYSKEEVLDAWELGAREGLPLTRKKKEELFNKFKKK